MSSVSFFRKQLKIKGKSVHSGRGFYEMSYDCDAGELAARIEQMIVRLGNKVTVYRNGHCVGVTLKDEYCEERYYNTLMVRGPYLTVNMYSPKD